MHKHVMCLLSPRGRMITGHPLDSNFHHALAPPNAVLSCLPQVLAMVYTFASSDPGVQSLILTLLCVGFFAWHLLTAPLRSQQSQTLQSMLLACLVGVALSELPFTIQLEKGVGGTKRDACHLHVRHCWPAHADRLSGRPTRHRCCLGARYGLGVVPGRGLSCSVSAGCAALAQETGCQEDSGSCVGLATAASHGAADGAATKQQAPSQPEVPRHLAALHPRAVSSFNFTFNI